MTEHAAGSETGSGSFAFADVDLTDTHTVSQVALIGNDNPAGSELGSLTVTVSADSTGSGTAGRVTWNYNVNDGTLQYLAAGQTVHETYQVTLADNHGGTTTQNVMVTITGTNEAPVIVASPNSVTSAAVIENNSLSGIEVANGTFAFADVDLTDTHAVSQVALIANDSPLGAALGTLTASVFGRLDRLGRRRAGAVELQCQRRGARVPGGRPSRARDLPGYRRRQ